MQKPLNPVLIISQGKQNHDTRKAEPGKVKPV